MAIGDVAKMAGTSVATVSRYFNNGYVGEKTRQRIEEAIRATGYRPDPIARALNKKSTFTIGLILPSISNTFFPELAAAIEQVATQQNFKLILCNANGSLQREEAFIRMLGSFHADGIITATGDGGDLYASCGLPVVAVDRFIGSASGSVRSDHYKGGRLGLEHLHRCGCRRVLFIREPQEHDALARRLAGARDQAAAYSDLVLDTLTLNAQPEPQELSAVLDRFTQYDGIFAWNDLGALHIMHACLEHGIRIPQDLQIVGFDNTAMSRLMIPQLTTVSQDITAMGSQAAEMLVKLIQGEALERNEVVLETELIPRETTNPAQ